MCVCVLERVGESVCVCAHLNIYIYIYIYTKLIFHIPLADISVCFKQK